MFEFVAIGAVPPERFQWNIEDAGSFVYAVLASEKGEV